MAHYDIIAMGGGALWARAFNAVAMIMGDSTYKSILTISTLTGFAVG